MKEVEKHVYSQCNVKILTLLKTWEDFHVPKIFEIFFRIDQLGLYTIDTTWAYENPNGTETRHILRLIYA